MSLGTILNGFVLGYIIRELIDLNSKKAIYNISEKQENGKISNKMNPEVYKWFGIYISIFLIVIALSVINFYSFFQANSLTSVKNFGALSAILMILYFYKERNKLNAQESIYEKIEVLEQIPTSTYDLRKLLSDPEKIPYRYEKHINKLSITQSIQKCFEMEGDTIAIYGGKWSGKNRLVNEVLSDPFFSGRTEFKVNCINNENNLLPFIDGMKSLPRFNQF